MDVELVLRARLWVARLGESDVRRWWRTDGILGPDGAFVGPRVLPRTHRTARARIAFAVARHACAERFPDPAAVTLFSLDPQTEDRLDAYLVSRLGEFEWWAEISTRLEAVTTETDPTHLLIEEEVITEDELDHVRGRNLGPDARSLPVAPGANEEETLRRLAAGFVRSQPGALAVPYLQRKS